METTNQGYPDTSEQGHVSYPELCVCSACPTCAAPVFSEVDHAFDGCDGSVVSVEFVCAACESAWEEPGVLRVKAWVE